VAVEVGGRLGVREDIQHEEESRRSKRSQATRAACHRSPDRGTSDHERRERHPRGTGQPLSVMGAIGRARTLLVSHSQ
jgi:hypothetical protein